MSSRPNLFVSMLCVYFRSSCLCLFSTIFPYRINDFKHMNLTFWLVLLNFLPFQHRIEFTIVLHFCYKVIWRLRDPPRLCYICTIWFDIVSCSGYIHAIIFSDCVFMTRFLNVFNCTFRPFRSLSFAVIRIAIIQYMTSNWNWY